MAGGLKGCPPSASCYLMLRPCHQKVRLPQNIVFYKVFRSNVHRMAGGLQWQGGGAP